MFLWWFWKDPINFSSLFLEVFLRGINNSSMCLILLARIGCRSRSKSMRGLKITIFGITVSLYVRIVNVIKKIIKMWELTVNVIIRENCERYKMWELWTLLYVRIEHFCLNVSALVSRFNTRFREICIVSDKIVRLWVWQ